jgi:hypothetical protein
MNTTYKKALTEVGALGHRDIPILETISVSHPSGGSINIVNDRKGLIGWANETYNAKVVYEAGSFSIGLPQSNADGVSFVNVAFPNIDGKASKFLKDVPVESTAPITLVYRLYLGPNNLYTGNDDSYHAGFPRIQNYPPLTVDVLNVEVSPFQVNARATFRSLVNAKYPNKLYTIEDYPAINN